MSAARFRDGVARDLAWARYYRRGGLAPVLRTTRAAANAERLADYRIRRALRSLSATLATF